VRADNTPDDDDRREQELREMEFRAIRYPQA
jgi:hypothetical protein